MTKDKSTDIEKLTYQLEDQLIAFSSMLEAFEVAAQAEMQGNSKRGIDALGMFSQCNFTMAQIMDLHQKLKTAVSGP